MSIPFKQHFKELQYRVYYSFLHFILLFTLLYKYQIELIYILIQPLIKNKVNSINVTSLNFIYTNLTEAFFSIVYVLFLSSLFLSIPYLLFQIYLFLKPGLFKFEVSVLNFFFPLLISLTWFSLLILYYKIIPLICKFFLEFERHNKLFSIILEPKINEYFFFLFDFSFNFLVGVLLLTIFISLFYFKVLKNDLLLSYRKLVLLCCFFFAAIITPPDVASQLIIGLVFYISYEIFIICLFIHKQFMELIGLEPTTSCMQNTRSTY